MAEESDPKTYIGDGVYAIFDGCGIMLRLNDHRNEVGQIYLEREVLQSLVRFAKREGIKI